MTSPVKSADARLVNLRDRLHILTNQLEECQKSPNSDIEKELLKQAENLLTKLKEDLQKTRNEMAAAKQYTYDTSPFEGLSNTVEGLIADINRTIERSGARQGLAMRLADSVPRTDSEWFHGTDMFATISILDDGEFHASETGGAGKKFGNGTYFTRDPSVAKKYGACVFGIRTDGLNILRARELSGKLQILIGEDWKEAPDKAREAINPCAELTKLAGENGYHAIEYTESVEGNILIVLIDIKVDATNVVNPKEILS